MAERLATIKDETLEDVEGMIVRCADVYLDDIQLAEAVADQKVTYAIVPGAAIGGVLGAEKGTFATQGDVWYAHYNDLGTVVATTDENGDDLGVYVPDHFGNYRSVSGTRPDTMGLTGKFLDSDADLYYFGARWYDPERGREIQ